MQLFHPADRQETSTKQEHTFVRTLDLQFRINDQFTRSFATLDDKDDMQS